MKKLRDIDKLNEEMNNYLVRKNVVKVIRGGKQNHNINIDDKKTNY